MAPSRLSLVGALLGALAFTAPALAGGPHGPLIETKAGSVISLKITLKLTGSMGERSFDQERNLTSSGVVVDASGLVMVQAGAVSFPRRPGMDIKVTPTSIRAIFPGDEKEYEAILGAIDTKLNLAYVLIRDLGERKATPLDLTKSVEPALGDLLYAVTRLGQGYDYAPICQTANVVGQVQKPRPMWVIDGEAPEAGHPLYTADGTLTGIMITQEGVGEGGGQGTFLLPLKIAVPSIERSLKMAREALEELKTSEAEAAAKAKEAEAAGGADAKPGEKPGETPPEKPGEKPPEPPVTPEQPK